MRLAIWFVIDLLTLQSKHHIRWSCVGALVGSLSHTHPSSKRLAIDDRLAMLLVLFACHPHGLERCQRCQNAAAQPRGHAGVPTRKKEGRKPKIRTNLSHIKFTLPALAFSFLDLSTNNEQ